MRFLLCVIYIFAKYVWVVPLKEKKALQLLMFLIKPSIDQVASQRKYG